MSVEYLGIKNTTSKECNKAFMDQAFLNVIDTKVQTGEQLMNSDKWNTKCKLN
jgi:hypothetical protein